MHELSIAKAIVESGIEHIKKGQKVISIHVKVGVLSGVVKEALEFAFPEVCRGTSFEGAQLEIEKVPLLLYCKSCHQLTHSEDIVILCQHCYDTEVEIQEGKEILIQKMEVE
ncbi:MAG: hydrogenase maturation nickel metallochaperone HypA [Bacteriovoracaceae bacterium]